MTPIGIWHGEIVEGHGRHIAAKELGMETVPVIKLDDMTDEERRYYMLTHNQTTMNSGWDMGLLDIELAEITDIDMTAFGFGLEIEDFDMDGLDDETTGIDKTVVRLVFDTYRDYQKRETEIKEFAAEIGASMTVGK